MQTATATVAGRRRVSFTLPEPAATTFIPRDVESEGRRSTWPPTRTERYPEGLVVKLEDFSSARLTRLVDVWSGGGV